MSYESQPNSPALRVEGLRLQYGDLPVIWGASFAIMPGTATAVVGRNGAGKTSLMAGLAGTLRPSAGQIFLAGQEITRSKPWQRTKRGLCLVPEGKRVFRDLTVEDNLSLGTAAERNRAARRRIVSDLLERFPILGEKRRASAGSLSGGQQQLLAIATALAAQPTVLLLDEPSSGLSPVAVDVVLDVLQTLKAEGVTLLVVEQSIDEVVNGLADKILVVDRGRIVLDTDVGSISADDFGRFVYLDDTAGPDALSHCAVLELEDLRPASTSSCLNQGDHVGDR